MISYLSDPKRNCMSVAAFDLIDWSAVWESLLGFAPLFCMWASKHVSRYCAVGHMQIRWGFWDHDCCPCCHLPDETTTHLLLCQHPGMKLTWSIQVDTLKDWMEEVDTHPNIIEWFIAMLMTRDSSDSFAANSSNFCQDVALAQDKIGWQNLVEGKLSMLWRDLQDEHYSSIGSRQLQPVWLHSFLNLSMPCGSSGTRFYTNVTNKALNVQTLWHWRMQSERNSLSVPRV